jgi:hypothetical protein
MPERKCQEVPWPAVPRPGRRRGATRFAAATVAIAALAACGTPSGLDREEQLAFARACTSLIERNLSDNTPPRSATLDNADINLDDPTTFYETLERLRGASTFDLHDPKHSADTARQPLDNCDPKPKVLSSLLGSHLGSGTSTSGSGSTSSTTTTTGTTVPGS